MASIRRVPTGNVVLGELPRGCEYCLRGRKAVIFVTGLCPRNCFYCPLSSEKKGRDVFYVNEVRVGSLKDMVREVSISAVEGAGLTGGDPLVRLQRTLRIIETLKREFGRGFHIHLYTSGVMLNDKVLRLLIGVGLDELRIHPPPEILDTTIAVVKNYVNALDIGFELPVIPGEEGYLTAVIAKLEDAGIKFLNLNELEFSETNYAALLQRGYEVSDDYISARGSRETALRVLSFARSRGACISVHFCPAVSKDRYQTSLRLFRRAIVTALPFEHVTDYGTLVFAEGEDLKKYLPKQLYSVRRSRIVGSVFYSDFLANPRVVEELASADRLRVYEA